MVLLAVGYFGYRQFFSGDAEVRYMLAQAEQGTLVVSVTGSGQVSVANQIDLKPKTSGDLVYLGVKNGQKVRKGTLIAQLDARDVARAVRDATANLESVKLAFEKLKKPADDLSLLQVENALTQTQESKQKAEDNLKKAYEDGYTVVANTFLALPAVMTGLEDLLYGNTLEPYQWNVDWYSSQVSAYDDPAVTRYKYAVNTAYDRVRRVYATNLEHHRSLTRNANAAAIVASITETYETVRVIGETVKAASNYIDYVKDVMVHYDLKVPAMVTAHQSNLASYTGTTNTHLSTLLSAQRTIDDTKASIVSAERSIAERTEQRAALLDPPDAFDVKSQELTIKQRENALRDAKERYADYVIRAPFDGVIARLDGKRGDAVSPSTIIGILVAPQQIAEIPLNEIDAVRITVGQKATLTFDAIPDLTIAGTVADVDAIGTVSQGVVTYTVKLTFDTPDERIKPGMSVSAAIIVDTVTNALLVPNAAVKQQGDASYVDVPADATLVPSSTDAGGMTLAAPPRRQSVEVGLSNDEFTEIRSGLTSGDVVIARTIQPAAEQQTQQPSGIRVPGLTGGGSGGGSRGSGGFGR